MQRIISILVCYFLSGAFMNCKEANKPVNQTEITTTIAFKEPYRPQFHFTPAAKWMNDPNGLVYHQGTYHLFYQYYPGDIVWGPMHWGHAVSKDMVYWEHQPIALYPDENGYIFSGSAVVDTKNTSGLGTADNPPLVAIFTYHDDKAEKAGRQDFQTQGIAYSTDDGQSWIPYEGNPVINNEEGIRDFRDPKVFWHEESGVWIMVLVAGDHARFYRSANLISWEYMSSFGKDVGAHGGVWECPDLFPLKVNEDGEVKWVLIISINPGAPNGGSGTQYFVGNFDGTTFTSGQKEEQWLDWGTDNYAGVTYNNVPSGERIFIGWMSNWDYARDTPTEVWRSAMTLPRKLGLRQEGNSIFLTNVPLEDLGTILKSEINQPLSIEPGLTEAIPFDHFNQAQILFKTNGTNFGLSFTNLAGDTLKLDMDGIKGEVLLDRSASGQTAFSPKFATGIQRMPLKGYQPKETDFRILMDWSSIELFIDQGRYVMTSQVFPHEHYNQLLIENKGQEVLQLNDLDISRAESIWD